MRGGGQRPLEERRHGDEQAGMAIVELTGELVRRVQRVDRGGDPAQDRDRVEHDGVFGEVRAVHAEHVAFPEAAHGQPGGHAAHIRRELAVAQRPATRGVDQRRLVAQLRRPTEHQLGKRDVWDLQLGPWAAVHDRRTGGLDCHAANLPKLLG